MNPKYKKRVENFSDAFKKDIIDTLKRIDAKDGKAYPYRIFKSVSKRWASVYRYKITLALQYFEYLGLVVCTLEPLEEYQARMAEFPGLNRKGLRRKYYKMNPKRPSESRGSFTEYVKLSYQDLGVPHEQLTEYPV